MTKKLTSILLFFLSLTMTVPVHAAVVINEIYPKTSDVTREWVELYNTDATSVSLDRWKLDHTAGDAKSFIINASAIIQPHGFLTFTGSQTNISFSIDGDTVRLFDVNGVQVDSQNYPGTLGYNTSMGRSADGSGSWAICTTATYNTNNNCPEPSPTATPIPTSTPQPRDDRPPAETPTPTSIPTPIQQTFGSLLTTPATTQVLGAVAIIPPTPTPTPTPPVDILQFKLSKSGIAYFLLGIAAAAASAILVLWLRRQQIRSKL